MRWAVAADHCTVQDHVASNPRTSFVEIQPAQVANISESAAHWSRHAALLSSQSAQAANWASKTANEATASARNAVAQMVYLSDALENGGAESTGTVLEEASEDAIGPVLGTVGAAVVSTSWAELRSA